MARENHGFGAAVFSFSRELGKRSAEKIEMICPSSVNQRALQLMRSARFVNRVLWDFERPVSLPRGDDLRKRQTLKNNDKFALLRCRCYHDMLPLARSPGDPEGYHRPPSTHVLHGGHRNWPVRCSDGSRQNWWAKYSAGSYAHIYSDIYRTLDRCLQATLIL